MTVAAGKHLKVYFGVEDFFKATTLGLTDLTGTVNAMTIVQGP